MQEISASRRYSPFKLTKSTAERAASANRSKIKNPRHFCHLTNGLYMGGMDGFKMNGEGIILLDNGTCMLAKHSYENMIDLNVIFRNNSLTAMIIKPNKNKYICYRTGPYILSAQLNCRNSAEGTGYMIDFSVNKLYKIVFYHSEVYKKYEIRDHKINDRIFKYKNYNDILDPKLCQVLTLNFDFGNNIKCSSKDEQLMVGFVNKGQIEGLGFKMKLNINIYEFEVVLQERAYYEKNRIYKFGYKWFKNGNYYFGGFKNGVFYGNAMLVSPSEDKWTYGNYRKGELVNIYESSATSRSKTYEVMKKIHENYDSYINNNFKFQPLQGDVHKILNNVISFKNEYIVEDPLVVEKRRIENLRQIKNNFIMGNYEAYTERIIKYELNRPISKKKLNPYTYYALKSLKKYHDENEHEIGFDDFVINVQEAEKVYEYNFNDKEYTPRSIITESKPTPKKMSKTFGYSSKKNRIQPLEIKYLSSNIENMNRYFKDIRNTAANSQRTHPEPCPLPTPPSHIENSLPRDSLSTPGYITQSSYGRDLMNIQSKNTYGYKIDREIYRHQSLKGYKTMVYQSTIGYRYVDIQYTRKIYYRYTYIQRYRYNRRNDQEPTNSHNSLNNLSKRSCHGSPRGKVYIQVQCYGEGGRDVRIYWVMGVGMEKGELVEG